MITNLLKGKIIGMVFLFLVTATMSSYAQSGSKLQSATTTPAVTSNESDEFVVPYLGKVKRLYENGKPTPYYRPALEKDMEEKYKEHVESFRKEWSKGWIDEIIGLLAKEQNPDAKREWLFRLSNAGPEDVMKAYKAIVEQLEKNNTPEVKRAAMSYLMVLVVNSGGDDLVLESIAKLHKNLENDSPAIRVQAASLLANYGEKETAKKVLLTELKNKNNRNCDDCGCRKCIPIALAQIGQTTDIKEALKESAIDENETAKVRLSVIDILSQMGEKNVGADFLKRVGQMSENKWLRMQALAIIAQQEDWDTLKQASVNDVDNEVKEYSQKLLRGCKGCK